jgi:oligopeptide transport system permease protein
MSDRDLDQLPPPGEGGSPVDDGAAAPPPQGSEGATAATGGVDATASLWGDAWRILRRQPQFVVSAALIVIFMLMAAFPQLFTSIDPRSCSLSNSLLRPSADNWFGTDLQGCDYYARTIYGARASISVGLLTVSVSAMIAIVFGTLAGFYRGWVDGAIARLTDIVFGIPVVLGALVLLQVLPERGVREVSFVLVLFGWTTMLRLMRSTVLQTAESEYVQAARALGASDLRLMRRHVLPNAITPVIVYGTVSIGIIIVAEATLTFLGVGLQLPAISWGLAITNAQSRLLQAPHLLLFPGAFLSTTVLSFILMGDALRDALDPKLR